MTINVVLSAFTTSPIILLATTKVGSILSFLHKHEDSEEDMRRLEWKWKKLMK
jgi:hypothetical protein